MQTKARLVTYGGAALIALTGLILMLALTGEAQANCQRNPDLPRCHPTPPPTPPPAPPPASTCDHTIAAGKDGAEGNDDCAQITTPPPPPVVLLCPPGTQEVARSASMLSCVKTNVEVVTKVVEKPVVKWRTRTVVKWKTRTVTKIKRRVIHHFCPVPGQG